MRGQGRRGAREGKLIEFYWIESFQESADPSSGFRVNSYPKGHAPLRPYATREAVSSAYNAHRTKVCVLCFYEAACCQAPFPFYMSVTPSVVNRASGFLIREAVICLERTSIRAGFLCQTPNAVFALRRSGKRRGERPHLTGGLLKMTKQHCTGSSHQLDIS